MTIAVMAVPSSRKSRQGPDGYPLAPGKVMLALPLVDLRFASERQAGRARVVHIIPCVTRRDREMNDEICWRNIVAVDAHIEILGLALEPGMDDPLVVTGQRKNSEGAPHAR